MDIRNLIEAGRTALCIEFGSTRIKAILTDPDGNILVPFRTWRNSNTQQAADALTDLFDFNIPLRWTISHLYQCILNKELHVKDIDFVTTLDSYITWKLTGEKNTGVGDASGIFPIGAFTDTFQDLFGMNQLPGIAVQNLMDKGVGFGPEGDYKISAFGAVLIKMSETRDGATGDGIQVTLIDMGDHFRIICADIELVKQPAPMPNLPEVSASGPGGGGSEESAEISGCDKAGGSCGACGI